MAVITIKIAVDNLDAVLEQFDRIKVHRATAGEAGPYVELTDAGTRLVLETGVFIYEYTDQAGDENYWYRSSYYHSTTTLESSLSDPQQGEGNAALDILSVDQLKTRYLFGLDLTNDANEEYPDDIFENGIISAVDWLEHKLDIPILLKVVEDERHDYSREDYAKYMWLNLDHYPVIDVEEVRMVLPGEQEVANFDSDWFQIQRDSGQLQIVPGQGATTSILLGAAGPWLPYIYSGARFIPNVFRVKYTAGFASGNVPRAIVDLIGKIASFAPLNIAGDLLGGAGIASQSLGLDGLSQSFSTTSSATNAGYGARLVQYGKEIKDMVPTLQRYYKGLRLAVC
jgi:hypothetical protein